MNEWFGPASWGAPICEGPRVDIPVGQPCLYCQEAIGKGDCGVMMPVAKVGRTTYIGSREAIHRECEIRNVIGSVGHQTRKCRCFGGNESDPPGMTKRQAAIAACEVFDGTEYVIP